MPQLTDSRFPGVAPDTGHYESWFVKANHPSAPQAFWLRHTVHQRPGEPQTASLWLTLFDGDEVRAGKQTVAGASVPAGTHIAVAGAELRPGRAHGALTSPTLDADWDLTFTTDEDEARLPYAWMYTAPIPKTKTGTPYPGAVFAGRLGPFALDGWTGVVSHNWGSEHAHRWVWSHADLGAGRGWLELAFARIRVAGRTLPWIANGALQLDGERHRLGGLDRARGTKVDERPTGMRFVATGADVRVEGTIAAPAQRFVCWRYADPAGPEHHSAHSSVADLRMQVRRGGRAPELLEAPLRASYELGMAETDHGLPVQPYDDGRL